VTLLRRLLAGLLILAQVNLAWASAAPRSSDAHLLAPSLTGTARQAGGVLRAETLSISVAGDLDLIGGQLIARHGLTLSAGGDIRILAQSEVRLNHAIGR
jgi:adhesin HecA-like repeat protein